MASTMHRRSKLRTAESPWKAPRTPRGRLPTSSSSTPVSRLSSPRSRSPARSSTACVYVPCGRAAADGFRSTSLTSHLAGLYHLPYRPLPSPRALLAPRHAHPEVRSARSQREALAVVDALTFPTRLRPILFLSRLPISETIRVDLIVFLAIFADVATIAIAYDNAQSAHRPVEWQLPKVWIMSTILGFLLAGGTWICRATMFVGSDGKGGIIQNYGSVQEVLFLEVALTESWLILITRVSSPLRACASLPGRG